jgi:hypothetical protein
MFTAQKQQAIITLMTLQNIGVTIDGLYRIIDLGSLVTNGGTALDIMVVDRQSRKRSASIYHGRLDTFYDKKVMPTA